MLRRPRPTDEVQLLEACRRNRIIAVAAFDAAFIIADFIHAASDTLSCRGHPLSLDQKKRWRYELTRDFLALLDRQEKRWLDEEASTVTFWFWRRSEAILNQKWNAFLSQRGPGGIRHSLRRYAQEFVSDWIRVRIGL